MQVSHRPLLTTGSVTPTDFRHPTFGIDANGCLRGSSPRHLQRAAELFLMLARKRCRLSGCPAITGFHGGLEALRLRARCLRLDGMVAVPWMAPRQLRGHGRIGNEARTMCREGRPYNRPQGALRAVPDASGVLENAAVRDSNS